MNFVNYLTFLFVAPSSYGKKENSQKNLFFLNKKIATLKVYNRYNKKSTPKRYSFYILV
jgi:hypothetical protein